MSIFCGCVCVLFCFVLFFCFFWQLAALMARKTFACCCATLRLASLLNCNAINTWKRFDDIWFWLQESKKIDLSFPCQLSSSSSSFSFFFFYTCSLCQRLIRLLQLVRWFRRANIQWNCVSQSCLPTQRPRRSRVKWVSHSESQRVCQFKVVLARINTLSTMFRKVNQNWYLKFNLIFEF